MKRAISLVVLLISVLLSMVVADMEIIIPRNSGVTNSVQPSTLDTKWEVDHSHHRGGRRCHPGSNCRHCKHSMHPHPKHRSTEKPHHDRSCEPCKTFEDGDYPSILALLEKARTEYKESTLVLLKAVAKLRENSSELHAEDVDPVADPVADAQLELQQVSTELDTVISELAHLKDICRHSNAILQDENLQLQEALQVSQAESKACHSSLSECETGEPDPNKLCAVELSAVQQTLAATQSEALQCHISLAFLTTDNIRFRGDLDQCRTINTLPMRHATDLASCHTQLAAATGNATACAYSQINEKENGEACRSKLASCLENSGGSNAAVQKKLDECLAFDTATHTDLTSCLLREKECEDRAAVNSSLLQDTLRQCQDESADQKRDNGLCHELLGKCESNIASAAYNCQRSVAECDKREASCEKSLEENINALDKCRIDLSSTVTNRRVSEDNFISV